jgi:hypothetical protein
MPDSTQTGSVHDRLHGRGVLRADAVRRRVEIRWDGSVTLEIRYRYAVEKCEPLEVLHGALLAERSILAGE